MISIRVLFFATFRDMAGSKEANLEIPEGTSVAAFKKILGDQFPNLPKNMQAVLIAVNKEFGFDEDIIPDEAEVAVFPPVSGGSGEALPDVFRVTNEVVDLNAILEEITRETTGAACFFTGMVRAVTERGDGHETAYLEYEAYHQMAEEKMRQVAEEMRAKWPSIEGIAIVQRVGRLQPGTPTVMVACTAGHRDTGVFEAARYGIDRLKQIVPVWKKEVGPEGEEWVEGEYLPTQGDV
ncbi:MAG: molybdenum cofactor biosynthesis protein MoaE [Anaerolineae bacterium]|nr:molybdenum cofactor biosynthesis protein MoaE [Anaerolineae bacterium]